MIQLKRVYDPPDKHDGVRFLVDRLWPRGIRKEDLAMDEWLKEVAPSTDLRKWFSHNPDRWDEFERKYFSELEAKPETWEVILTASRNKKVTLLYAARDTDHNNAVALLKFLNSR